MQAAILTVAGIRRFDDHLDAFYAITGEQENAVLQAIQRQHLSDEGMLIIIEGYATIQKTGTHQELLSEVVTSQATGNHPNTEPLHCQVVYYSGRGILGLRVVYTTNPLKRIVYDITVNDIQESHV